MSHRHLLLDFGGPCLVSPVELHRSVEDHFGLASGTLDWTGPTDPDADELYRRSLAEDGISERDYWELRAQEVGGHAGVDLDTRAYMRVAYDTDEALLIRPEADAVRRAAARAGIGVSVLTNDLRAFHDDAWVGRIGFLGAVDHVVDLSHTGTLKPDPAAYALALDRIGAADPSQVLFVDDQPRNVEGARRAGMDAVWFDIRRPGHAWAEVADRLGVDVVWSGAAP